jgi:hypothetical protein
MKIDDLEVFIKTRKTYTRKVNKMKKIPVIVIRDSNSGEPDEVYRLDKESHAKSFFANTNHNVERNDIHHFCVEDWTNEQWRLAELSGLATNGESTPKQDREFDKLLKKIGKHKERAWPS